MNAAQFGMTEAEFETAKTETRTWYNWIFKNGGYPAIEAKYTGLDALVKAGKASGLEQYRSIVLRNIPVMA